jgi:TRAP-type C4-dicarboxylate transport system substrate-binding protein
MKKYNVLLLFLIMILATFTFVGCGGENSVDTDGEIEGTETTEPIRLRLASDAPEDHIATRLNREACDMIFERTQGRVEVTYYPAGQLGDYTIVYDELTKGTVDLAQITVPDALDSRLGICYTTAIANDYEEARKILGAGSFINEKFIELNKGFGVEFMGFCLEGFVGIGTVDTPTDMTIPGNDKKIKLRSSSVDPQRIAVEDLGFNVVTIAYGEVPTSLQTGVVDGWIGGTANMNYTWVGEIINTYYQTYIMPEATAYVASDISLAKLSEEDRRIVIEVFNEQSNKSFDLAKENDQEYMRKMNEEFGVEIIEFTYEQREAQRDFLMEVSWPKYAELWSQEWIDAIKADVAAL